MTNEEKEFKHMETLFGPWVFVRRNSVRHECPDCLCRGEIRAILWTGFNESNIGQFMKHHGKDKSWRVESETYLVISDFGSAVPVGWWLVAEKGILSKYSASSFVLEFARA